MIKVAHIMPVNMVKPGMVRQDVEMYLTHKILEHPETFRFLSQDKRNAIHSYKILDNSACELGEGLDFTKVLEAAQIIDADEIILPDIPKSTESFSKTMKYLRELSPEIIAKYKIAGVVQGDSWESIQDCMDQLLSIKAIKTIMIPKWYADRHNLVDSLLFKMKEHHRGDIQIHLLGLNSIGIREMMYSVIKDNVRSFDTGYFVAKTRLEWKNLDVIDPRPRDFKIDLESMDVNKDDIKTVINEIDQILEL